MKGKAGIGIKKILWREELWKGIQKKLYLEVESSKSRNFQNPEYLVQGLGRNNFGTTQGI